jgi:hypothetical protein
VAFVLNSNGILLIFNESHTYSTKYFPILSPQRVRHFEVYYVPLSPSSKKEVHLLVFQTLLHCCFRAEIRSVIADVTSALKTEASAAAAAAGRQH